MPRFLTRRFCLLLLALIAGASLLASGQRSNAAETHPDFAQVKLDSAVLRVHFAHKLDVAAGRAVLGWIKNSTDAVSVY